jgi:hypothetical protein
VDYRRDYGIASGNEKGLGVRLAFWRAEELGVKAAKQYILP